jgi:hypothetical protein
VIACIKSVSSGERSPNIATASGADFEVLAARWLVSRCWVYSRAPPSALQASDHELKKAWPFRDFEQDAVHHP